jgi:RHS repeat-associated protein
VTSVDVDLPSLMDQIGLRMVRVHSSSRLTVPLPLPSPAIHDGPLGLGWTFHFGVLWPPTLPGPTSGRWSLVNGDGSVEVFYVHNHLSSTLPITSVGSNPEWISESVKVLRLVTANVKYEMLTPDGLKYTFERPAGFASSRFVPTQIEDRHGNLLTIAYVTTQDYIEHPIIDYIKDQEDRRIVFVYQTQTGPGTLRRLDEIRFKKGSGGNGTLLGSYMYETDSDGAYALLKTHTTAVGRETRYTNDTSGGTDGLGSILGVTLPTGGVISATYEVKQFNATTSRAARVLAAKTLTRSGFTTTYSYSENPSNRELTTTLTIKQGSTTVRTQSFTYITYGTQCTDAWMVGFPKSSSDSFDGTSKTITHGAPTSFKISNDPLSPDCPEQIFVPQPASTTETRDGFDFVTTYDTFDAVNLPLVIIGPGGFNEERAYHKVATNTRLLLGLEKEFTVRDGGGEIVRRMTNNLSGAAVRPTLINLTRQGSTSMQIDLGYYTSAGKKGAVHTWTVGAYVETYNYENGTLKSIDYPEGPDVARTINNIGTIQNETRGTVTTIFTWDDDLRLLTSDPPADDITTINYYPTSIELWRGTSLKLTLTYDGYGRLVTRTRPIESGVSAVESFGAFNPLNLPTDETISAGAVYDVSYDVNGRVKSRSASGDNNTFTYSADANGTTITHTRNGAARVQKLDHLGRPLGGTLGTNDVSVSYFDIGGAVDTKARVTSEGQPDTSDIGWNGLSEIESRSTPETGAISFVRTPQGWVERINRPGLSHIFGLDGIGRIKTITKVSGSLLASFEYQSGYGVLDKATTTAAASSFVSSGVTVDPDNFDGKGRPQNITITIPRALPAPLIVYPKGLFCSGPFDFFVPAGWIEDPYQPGNPSDIEWTDVDGADKYQLELREAQLPFNCDQGPLLERLEHTTTSVPFSSLGTVLSKGVLYCLRIRAVRGDEIGPFSFWKWFKIRTPSDNLVCGDFRIEYPHDAFECGEIAVAISHMGGTGDEKGCGDDNPPEPKPWVDPHWQPTAGDPSAVQFLVSFTYDGEGRIQTITHPQMDTSFDPTYDAGLSQSYTFTTSGLHETVQYGTIPFIVSSTDHFQDGQPTKRNLNYHAVNFKSGVAGTFERYFDNLGRITSEKATKSDLETPLYNAHTFQHNAWQFVERYTRADDGLNLGVTYGYTPERRLETFTVGSQMVTFGWDPAGNLTSRGDLLITGLVLPGWGPPGIASLNLPSFSGQTYSNNRAAGRTYDADGRETGDGLLQFVYNDLDQIARVIDPDSGWDVAQYLYDAHGNRVREVYGSEAVYSARDMTGRLVTQEVHRGSSPYLSVRGWPYPLKTDFIYHDGVHVASVVNIWGGALYPIIHHRNFLGHPVVSIQSNHKFIPEYYEYSPFGTQMRTERFARFPPTEFSQYEYDSPSNRYYAQARYYDPTRARFNRPDPGFDYDFTEAGSFNLYSHVRGNPIAFHDPSGSSLDLVLVAGEFGLATWGVGAALVAGTVALTVAETAFSYVGFTLAADAVQGIELRHLARPIPAELVREVDKSQMFGSGGTQVSSKTVWKGEGRRAPRIDVENPNPGQRPGQIHFQHGTDKYLYDPATRTFEGAPRSVNKMLEKPEIQRAINKAMKILGEE